MRKLAITVLALAAMAGAATAQPFAPVSAPAKATPAGFLDRPEARYCDDSGILGRIVSKFRHQVRNVPNLPDVDIVDFKRIHENRNHVATDKWPIARRYCGATAELSDGRQRAVWYLIEEGMGLASIGDNVEFCVAGFDRWYVFNGACRVLR